MRRLGTMAKDLNAENVKLKTQVDELRKQVDRLERERSEREYRNEDLRNRFKDLLIDVLGR